MKLGMRKTMVSFSNVRLNHPHLHGCLRFGGGTGGLSPPVPGIHFTEGR